MDLDRFKFVNDCHGHLAGSQVLREVGFLLKRIVQSVDATVARYGGDEFVMILPETPLEEALKVAEEIRATIAGTTFLEREWGFSMPPIHLRGVLSASVGVAPYLPDAGAAEAIEQQKNELLRRADGAMYEAKSRGKNCVVVAQPGKAFQARGGELSEAGRTSPEG
jgi:diguanylate cyclase